MISCRFCGTSNAREENRCFRCGRRLHLASARPIADKPPTSTVHEPASDDTRPPLQALSDAVSSGGVSSGGYGTATRMARYPEPLGGLPGEGEWGALSFQQAKETERAPESDIYTDARVAPLSARLMAGFYDGAVMAGAFAVMAVAYAVTTRNVEADSLPASVMGWLIYGALGIAVVVFYRSLFILAGGDSPGTRWAGLRLVTFDGEAPAPQDRFMRVAWGVFSALPLGLGLFWALVDQERLTWHDLLSKTFPSPDSSARNVPRWSR